MEVPGFPFSQEWPWRRLFCLSLIWKRCELEYRVLFRAFFKRQNVTCDKQGLDDRQLSFVEGSLWSASPNWLGRLSRPLLERIRKLVTSSIQNIGGSDVSKTGSEGSRKSGRIIRILLSRHVNRRSTPWNVGDEQPLNAFWDGFKEQRWLLCYKNLFIFSLIYWK